MAVPWREHAVKDGKKLLCSQDPPPPSSLPRPFHPSVADCNQGHRTCERWLRFQPGSKHFGAGRKIQEKHFHKKKGDPELNGRGGGTEVRGLILVSKTHEESHTAHRCRFNSHSNQTGAEGKPVLTPPADTHEGDAGSQQQDSDQEVLELLHHQLPQGFPWNRHTHDTRGSQGRREARSVFTEEEGGAPRR